MKKKILYFICILATLILFVFYHSFILNLFWQESFEIKPGETIQMTFPDKTAYHCTYAVFLKQEISERDKQVLQDFFKNDLFVENAPIKMSYHSPLPKTLVYFEIDECRESKKNIQIKLGYDERFENYTFVIKHHSDCTHKSCIGMAIFSLWIFLLSILPLLAIATSELIIGAIRTKKKRYYILSGIFIVIDGVLVTLLLMPYF